MMFAFYNINFISRLGTDDGYSSLHGDRQRGDVEENHYREQLQAGP